MPCLIAREYCADRSPAVLIFEINVLKRPSIMVPHNKAAVLFFNGPGWWKAVNG